MPVRPSLTVDQRRDLWRQLAWVGVLGGVGTFVAANVVGLATAMVAGVLTGHLAELHRATTSTTPPTWYTLGASIGMWATFVSLPILLVSRRARQPLEALGFGFAVVDLVGLPIGVVAQFVVGVVTVACFGHGDDAAPLHRWFDGQGPVVARVLALCLVVVVPIAEELTFRGLLGSGLLGLADARGGGLRLVAAATAVDGVLFAAAHGEARQFLGLALFGALQLALVRRTGRLGMAIASHAAFNAVAVSGVLLRGHL